MAIKWHEERIRRTYFGRDNEGFATTPPAVPLTSKWIPRATGMWIHAWGMGDDSATNNDIGVTVQSVCWEGTEIYSGLNSPQMLEREVASDVGSFILSVNSYAGAPPNLIGRISALSHFIDMPNMGASYPRLAVIFNGVSEQDGENQISAKPQWAAAKILYRVEH